MDYYRALLTNRPLCSPSDRLLHLLPILLSLYHHRRRAGRRTIGDDCRANVRAM